MEDYLRLAALQGAQPQEFAVFRRYLPLQAFRLLRQQTQIAYLQQALGQHVMFDRDLSDPAKVLSALALHTLDDNPPNERHVTQRRLWNDLDAKLVTYADSLLRFHALCRLPSVDRSQLQRLQDWRAAPEGGQDGFPNLEEQFWEEGHLDDLSAPGVMDTKRDILTGLVNNGVLALYHRLIGHKHRKRITLSDPFTEIRQVQPTGAYLYSDKHVGAAISTFNAVVASTIISMSAFVLHFIPSTRERLAAIVGFTFAFSLLFTVTTGASRAECFVATSAYAAVLVVFVGNEGCVCATGS